MAISDDKAIEIVEYFLENSEEATKENFKISSETLNRYKRHYRNILKNDDYEKKLSIKKIVEQYSDEELKAISEGGRITPGYSKVPIIDFSGQRIRFAHFTDTHFGSEFFKEEIYDKAIAECKKEGVEFICHSGDVTEGMSNRPGHIYELTHLGYAQQKEYAIEQLNKWDKKWYLIDGNHDCLDIETEVFTNSGWKKYNEINYNDKILSYDVKDGLCKWDTIKKIIIKEKEENMISIDFLGFSFLGTENHRVFHDKRKLDKNRIISWDENIYEKAKDIKGRIRIKTSAKSGNKRKVFLSDDEIKLSAWFLTDGGINRSKKNHTGKYTIYQSKPIDKIINILNSLNYEYRINIRNRNIKEIMGKILKKQPLQQKEIILNSDSSKKIKAYLPDKKVQDWMFNMTDNQFNVFLNSLIDGDGSRYKGKNRQKTYILFGEYKMLSDIQGLCAMHGYRAYLSQDNRDSYRLNICNKETIEFDCCKHKKTIQHKKNNIVWCLSVPETNFFVRRKGCAYFTGNSWFQKSNGAIIVEDIANNIKKAEFLGHSEGDISLKGKAVMKLWHGLDSSSYAVSYRVQKVIEAFTGGEKPHILLLGHVHKMGYFFDRHVHAVSGGALCLQSSWMRGKRLANHTGFWIIDAYVNKNGGISKFTSTFYPYYA